MNGPWNTTHASPGLICEQITLLSATFLHLNQGAPDARACEQAKASEISTACFAFMRFSCKDRE
jgi:hypothetical protein